MRMLKRQRIVRRVYWINTAREYHTTNDILFAPQNTQFRWQLNSFIVPLFALIHIAEEHHCSSERSPRRRKPSSRYQPGHMARMSRGSNERRHDIWLVSKLWIRHNYWFINEQQRNGDKQTIDETQIIHGNTTKRRNSLIFVSTKNFQLKIYWKNKRPSNRYRQHDDISSMNGLCVVLAWTEFGCDQK